PPMSQTATSICPDSRVAGGAPRLALAPLRRLPTVPDEWTPRLDASRPCRTLRRAPSRRPATDPSVCPRQPPGWTRRSLDLLDLDRTTRSREREAVDANRTFGWLLPCRVQGR